MIELLFDQLSPTARQALEAEAKEAGCSPEIRAAQILEDELDTSTSSDAPPSSDTAPEFEAEEALKMICRRLVSRSLVGFYLIQDGIFRYVNGRLAEIFGYEPSEITGELGPEDVVHPEDWPRVEENIRRRLEGEVESIQYAFRIRRKEGGIRDVEILGSRIVFEGRPAIAGTLVDVSEREEAQRALEFANHRYERLIEEAPSGIGLLRMGGTFQEANARLCAITGYSAEELHGMGLADLQAPSCEHEEILPAADLGTGGRLRQECLLKRADGTEVPVEISAALVQQNLAQLIVRDVSEQKRREAELEAAKEEAEEASEMKSAFLANMSHEIRTPITTILGFSDVLAAEVPPGYEEFIQAIRQSGERLQETLGEVLQLAELESGELQIRPRETGLRALAEEVVEGLRARADRKGLDLEVRGEQAVPAELDPRLIGRALRSLLENALKFTEEGGVTVEVVAEEGEAVLRVADTGIGMDPAVAERLFEPFRQGSTGLGREHEGTGLGLTVARRLTEAMGGTLELETQPGEGSRFTARLPREVGLGREQPPTWEAAPQWGLDQLAPGQRVLVVDDDGGMRTLIREMLPAEFETDLAASGPEALAKAEDQFYDLVLLDINLTSPDSGITVLKDMREIGRYEEALIVAITAYARPGDGDRFHEEGFDGYVPKPFTKADLRERLIQIVEQ